MRLRLASVLVVVLGTVVFAGSAFAGNGNGNGNEKSDPPGNSGNAPGQVKKDAVAASSAGDPAPPQADVAAPAEQTSSNATGVKPSNSTAHETHAPASSDRTKEYGNGQTAGEIAVKNGAKPSAILHGPGNSQPHKTAPCSGGHEVDVHALKGKGHKGSCGGPAPAPVPPPESHPNSVPRRIPDPNVAPLPSGNPPKHVQQPAKPARPKSGVLSSSGVLAATGAVAHGSLPFTGFPLWAVVILAAALIAFGLALRRRFSP